MAKGQPSSWGKHASDFGTCLVPLATSLKCRWAISGRTVPILVLQLALIVGPPLWHWAEAFVVSFFAGILCAGDCGCFKVKPKVNRRGSECLGTHSGARISITSQEDSSRWTCANISPHRPSQKIRVTPFSLWVRNPGPA